MNLSLSSRVNVIADAVDVATTNATAAAAAVEPTARTYDVTRSVSCGNSNPE